MNGCSDIALQRFLDSGAKLPVFRDFLSQYQRWLRSHGESIATDEINARLKSGRFGMRYLEPCSVQYLLDFVTKIEDVLDGNLANESVRRT